MSTPPRKTASTHVINQAADDPSVRYRVRDKDYALAKGQISPGVWGDNLSKAEAEKLKLDVVNSRKSKTARVEAMEVEKPDDGTLQVAQQRAADAAKRAAEDARRRLVESRAPAPPAPKPLPAKPPVAAKPIPTLPPALGGPTFTDPEGVAHDPVLDGDPADPASEPAEGEEEVNDGIDDEALGDLLDSGDHVSDEDVVKHARRALTAEQEQAKLVKIGDIVNYHENITAEVNGKPVTRLMTGLARVVGVQLNPDRPPLIGLHPGVGADMLELKDGLMRIRDGAKPTGKPIAGVPFAPNEEARDNTWSLIG